MVSSNCLLESFIFATDSLMLSASSRLPSFISAPICAASFLASLRLASSFCWASRRRLSTARTSSIASLAPLKCFFSNPRITRSVSSVMSLSVSIILIYYLTIYYFQFTSNRLQSYEINMISENIFNILLLAHDDTSPMVVFFCL